MGALSDNGDIVEEPAPGDTPDNAGAPNPFFKYIGVITTRDEARQLASKLVVSGIVAHVDRGAVLF